MSRNLQNRSFNIRVSFDEAGEPVIGYVHSFYNVDAECYDIKRVPDKDVIDIAKALGISKSSKTILLNKKLKKAQAKPRKAPVNQLDIVFLPGVGQSIVENFFAEQQLSEA